MQDKNSQPVALGSGFFVRQDTICTNLHVIKGATQGFVKFIGNKNNYEINGIEAVDSVRDLALLSIERSTAPALPLGDSNQIATGDEIYAVGNPQGLEGTFSQGIISSVRKFEQDTILQITAPISPGSSGGPILNNQGRVIGIAVSTYKIGQNLNFAIPVSYLSALMLEKINLIPLSKQKNISNKSSTAFDGLNTPSTKGIDCYAVEWGCCFGHFNFSMRNKLPYPVKDIDCVFIAYDRSGNPLDYSRKVYPNVIASGLAKRLDGIVNVGDFMGIGSDFNPAKVKLEFRILDFRNAE